jgi:hypothetical protein
MDVKVNFSGKQKGARVVPDTGLEEVDAFSLEKITKQILWRVAQGQYAPRAFCRLTPSG